MAGFGFILYKCNLDNCVKKGEKKVYKASERPITHQRESNRK